MGEMMARMGFGYTQMVDEVEGQPPYTSVVMPTLKLYNIEEDIDTLTGNECEESSK
jgi:hypothetical protein